MIIINTIKLWYYQFQLAKKQHNCSHEFYQDTQITCLRCEKCGMTGRLIGYKNLFKIG